MDYEQFYDLDTSEIDRIKAQDILHDYHLCKALAACSELPEYLAGQLGEMIARGEIDEN